MNDNAAPAWLTITTWNPIRMNEGTTMNRYTYPNAWEMLKFACRQIALRLEQFDEHYRRGLKRYWDNEEYPKMLKLWGFVSKNNSRAIGLIIEWEINGIPFNGLVYNLVAPTSKAKDRNPKQMKKEG